MGRIIIALVGLAGVTMFLSAAASASTPASWAALNKKQIAACTKASGLSRATVSPTRIGFSDRAGYDVRLVRGTYPQKHMNGAKGQMMCLYHRASGRVETQEFKGW